MLHPPPSPVLPLPSSLSLFFSLSLCMPLPSCHLLRALVTPTRKPQHCQLPKQFSANPSHTLLPPLHTSLLPFPLTWHWQIRHLSVARTASVAPAKRSASARRLMSVTTKLFILPRTPPPLLPSLHFHNPSHSVPYSLLHCPSLSPLAAVHLLPLKLPHFFKLCAADIEIKLSVACKE